MSKKMFLLFVVAMIVLPVAFFGCKAKVEKTDMAASTDMPEAIPTTEEAINAQAPLTEPAQTVATETIPPTAAAPQVAEKQIPVTQEKLGRAKDIQKALKNAGFYNGAIDGKIGPKTKKAIEEFQKAKGLKADGKVGPKTWAELEKYLTQ